jgi:hypothetical protein
MSRQVVRASGPFCARFSALCRLIYEGVPSGGPCELQPFSTLKVHCQSNTTSHTFHTGSVADAEPSGLDAAVGYEGHVGHVVRGVKGRE